MVRGAAGTPVVAAAPGGIGGGLVVPNRSGVTEEGRPEAGGAVIPGPVGAPGTTTICTRPEEPSLDGVTMRTGMTRRAGGGGVGGLCCSSGGSVGG